ncbi:MAG: hypothetical protein MUF54_07130 [Polyangiaceae bacterium]|jgi:hypothetical protein|nr:hypothetical protein [Polyangiaceae bacterium]
MTEREATFVHGAGFEAAEVTGNVKLGKFEAYYEALFAEVIEDGIITAQERARLDKAADTLGLERTRLSRLEQALQAAYEARHHVRIREVSDWTVQDTEPRAGLVPLEPVTDQGTVALERHIRNLEARIAELEYELAEARAHVPVEIDLADLRAARASLVEEDPADIQRRLRHDPRDVESLRELVRTSAKRGDIDRQWCATHVLVYLNAANDEDRAFHDSHRGSGLIRPSAALTGDGWRKLLFHPEQEILPGEILAVIAPAVLLGRVSALRRDGLLPKLDPARMQDPTASTLQAVRGVSWAASILGMTAPAFFVYPEQVTTLEMIPGLPPVTRLGRRCLSGRSPTELAFLAGRHLAYYREEHFIRALLPSIADLEDVLLAALSIGNPGLPLTAHIKQRVEPIAKAIEPVLEPHAIDVLRGHFLRFVEEGGRTNLQRWANAVDRTCARAGLLLASDLKAAREMLSLESPAFAEEWIDDMLSFMVSDRHASLRKQIGVAIGVA